MHRQFFGGASMSSSSLDIQPVEGFSHPTRLYTREIVLRTFIVRESNQPDKPFALGPRAGGSDDAARIARAIYETLDADKEHFVLLALNNKKPTCRLQTYQHWLADRLFGSSPRGLHRRIRVTACRIDLRASLRRPNACQEDIEITRRLRECGEMLGFHSWPWSDLQLL